MPDLEFAQSEEGFESFWRDLQQTAFVQRRHGVVWVTGYEEALSLLGPNDAISSDLGSSSEKTLVPFNASPDHLLFMDGPEHLRLRDAVGRTISTYANEAAAKSRVAAREALESLRVGSQVDLVPIVKLVVSGLVTDLLELSPGYAPVLGRNLDLISRGLTASTSKSDQTRMVVAGLRLIALFDAQSRVAHSPSVLGVRLAELEIPLRQRQASPVMLAHAAYENTSNAVTTSLLRLLSKAQLAGDDLEAPIPREVLEESLRSAAPAAILPRLATGVPEGFADTISSGDLVFVVTAAANADPREAGGSGRHLSFGHGSHSCPGARLARAEVTSILDEFVSRFPASRLCDYEWGDGFFFRGLRRLVVVLG